MHPRYYVEESQSKDLRTKLASYPIGESPRGALKIVMEKKVLAKMRYFRVFNQVAPVQNDKSTG